MSYSAARNAGWHWPGAALAVLVLALAFAIGLGTQSQGGASGSLAPTASPSGKLTPALARLAEKSPERKVEVIVQLRARTGFGPGKGSRLVTRAGGRVTQQVPIIRGLAAEMTAAQASRLAADPAVRAVTLNGKVAHHSVYDHLDDRLATAYNQSTMATDAWTNQELTGKGVGVAVIDTGIDGSLRDFETSLSDKSSRVRVSAVVNPDATTAKDSFGHGTHVAGLIAGNGHNRTDALSGKYVGVAPEADLISVKASAEDGSVDVLDVINGIQFVVDHKADYNIRVLNLSLSSTVAQSYKIDPLDAAVEVAWSQGITVLAAAGNKGANLDATHYAPGNDPYVITVGAVDDQGTKSIGDDKLASWSSHGLTQDGFSKPDVLAPGAHMVSNLAPNSHYGEACPTCVVSGEYLRIGGTSMATAVASGAAAAIIQEHPNWTPNEVKGALRSKSRDVPGAGREISVYDSAQLNDGDDLLRSNRGLVPNTLISEITGSTDLSRISWRQVDWERISWRRISWRTADPDLTAGWSRISWRAVEEPVAVDESGAPVDPTRISWRDVSWSTSFDK